MKFINNSLNKIFPYLKKNQCISLESTTYPGTCDEVFVPMLEKNSSIRLTFMFLDKLISLNLYIDFFQIKKYLFKELLINFISGILFFKGVGKHIIMKINFFNQRKSFVAKKNFLKF